MARIRYGIGAGKTLLVTVTLVDARGRPVPNAYVSVLVRRRGYPFFTGRGNTLGNGRATFRVRHLKGCYRTTVMRANADGYRWDRATPVNRSACNPAPRRRSRWPREWGRAAEGDGLTTRWLGLRRFESSRPRLSWIARRRRDRGRPRRIGDRHPSRPRGARVLLLDKAGFPRDKPCGGGLTLRAVRQLPGRPWPVVEHEVDRMEFRLGWRSRFERRGSAARSC